MTQPPSYPGSPETPDEPGGATPPPIPPPVAPAPPASPAPPSPPPYGTAPQQPPAYGNPYGAPQPPAYGAPQPYGNPYGASPYPGGPVPPGANEPSRGLAIAALVLSFLACTFIAGLVSIVLAVVVLVRGRDGRRHGKGLAIAAIVVSVLVMAGTVASIVAFADWAEDQGVENLETGDCVDARNLTDADATEIGLISTVSCSDRHDGQVVATSTLTNAQADDSARGIDCTPLVDPSLLAALDPDQIAIYGLTPDTTPVAGDTVACVAVRADGGRLTEKLG